MPSALKIVHKVKPLVLCGLFAVFNSAGSLADEYSEEQWNVCEKVLRSNCDATQEELLKEFLRDLQLYSLNYDKKKYLSDMPALEALPKDQFGMPNWIKAVVDGVITPRGSLTEEDEGEFEGFFDNLIVMQVNGHFMADVVFPHGMHTYWLSCNSCHPKPFQKKIGSSDILMKDIFKGKWCGKCHGKVAFPPNEYINCRRCHSISKSSLMKNDG